MAGFAISKPGQKSGPGLQPGIDRRQLVSALNEKIERIEHRPLRIDGTLQQDARPRAVSLGIAEIDAALCHDAGQSGSGTLAVGALHEVRAETALDLPASAGFALALGGLLAGTSGTIFWIAEKQARTEAGEFYGPGLAGLGIDPARLIRVFTKNSNETLWAAGEIAACPGTGFCLLELRGNPASAGLAFSRRLALRAQSANMPVLLLRQSGGEEASAAATRWRVSPAPSIKQADEPARLVGAPAWHAALEKSRGGRPGAWTLEWKRDECLFALYRGTAAIRKARSSAGKPSGHPGPDRPALSGNQPAQAFDGPDRTRALGSGVALERAS
ncbi:MAG: hypothetical protein AAF362_01410 [Pseudomonadota bacterium]